MNENTIGHTVQSHQSDIEIWPGIQYDYLGQRFTVSCYSGAGRNSTAGCCIRGRYPGNAFLQKRSAGLYGGFHRSRLALTAKDRRFAPVAVLSRPSIDIQQRNKNQP